MKNQILLIIKRWLILIIFIIICVVSYTIYSLNPQSNGGCGYKNTFYHLRFNYDCNSLSINPYGWGSTKDINRNYRTFSSKNNYLNQLSYHILDIDNNRGLCSWMGPLDPPYYTSDTLLCYQLSSNNNQQYIKETALMEFPSELNMNKDLEFYKNNVNSYKERDIESVLTNEQKISFYDIFWNYSGEKSKSTCTFIPNYTNKIICFDGDSNFGPQLKSILESLNFY